MFPSAWTERTAHKKRKVKEELKILLDQCGQAVETHDRMQDSDESIVNVIKRQVNDTRLVPAVPRELQLDHVLSSVPYQEMLESLFGGVNSGQPSLPLITKAYEESFMREPGPGERPCAMGAKCECMFIDPNAPFVGVEFKLEFGSEPKWESGLNFGEVNSGGLNFGEEAQTGAKTNTKPQMCVLCSRKTTQKLFYDACYTGRRVQGVIQRYGNLCNQPGEYARECMLICPPNAHWGCLPVPIMSHQRNRYNVQTVAGKKHLQQLRVSYEDFFVPPSGRALD